MKKEIVVAALLLTAILVSGCTQQAANTGGTGDHVSGDLEASAYDQIEQEMNDAVEDIDTSDLENELLM